MFLDLKSSGPTPGVRWAPAVVTAFALLAIPFYLGLVHLPFRSFIQYAGTTGVAMTTGTILDRWEGPGSESLPAVLAVVGLWTVLTFLIGGCSYLIAFAF